MKEEMLMPKTEIISTDFVVQLRRRREWSCFQCATCFIWAKKQVHGALNLCKIFKWCGITKYVSWCRKRAMSWAEGRKIATKKLYPSFVAERKGINIALWMLRLFLCEGRCWCSQQLKFRWTFQRDIFFIRLNVYRKSSSGFWNYSSCMFKLICQRHSYSLSLEMDTTAEASKVIQKAVLWGYNMILTTSWALLRESCSERGLLN